MKYNNICSINTLLQNSSILSSLYDKLQELKNLNNIVTNFLPSIIAQHCFVSNFKDKKLTLTTTSPVWNHQINYLKIDLLNKLRTSNPAWAGISSIVVKTDYLIETLAIYQQHSPKTSSMQLSVPAKPLKKISNISPRNIDIINNIANNQITYQPLAAALKNLVK